MARFVGHAFRLRGRASRSEFWWWILVSAIVETTLRVGIPLLIDGRFSVDATSGFFAVWLRVAGIAGFASPLDSYTPSGLASVFLTLASIWTLLTLIPGITVTVRRLHDGNFSGWWWFLGIIPVGNLVVFVMMLRASQPAGARFDEVPPRPYREDF